MAVFDLRNVAAFVCLSAVFVLDCQAAETAPSERSFEWTADVLNSDFRSDTHHLLGNVRVTQGAMSIEAQTATAQDPRSESGSSRWTFRDSVHIRTAQADLQSDLASASIVAGKIAHARVEGAPALFEQRGASADRQVRGRAGVIEYDFNAGVVRLTDQVWFSNGKDEFRGDVVVYNVRDERVQINPGGQSSGRVRGIIRPKDRSDESSASEAQSIPPPQSTSENGA
ncbi:MAG: LptA/OstA family protein [Steroidobacter sp.]